MIQAYQNYLIEKQYADTTVRNYVYTLKRLCKNNQIPTLEDFHKFIEPIVLSKSQNTVNWYKNVIKGYLKFLIRHGYDVQKLDDRIGYNYSYYRLPKIPSEIDLYQLDRLIASQLLTVEHRLLLSLLRNHGFKVKDILNLKFSDVSEGKANISRYEIPIPLSPLELNLIRYLQYKNAYRSCREDSYILFLNKNNRYSCIQACYTLLKKKYTITVNGRLLRNAYILDCYNKKVDTFSISYLLGIKTLNLNYPLFTIQKYSFPYLFKHVSKIKKIYGKKEEGVLLNAKETVSRI